MTISPLQRAIKASDVAPEALAKNTSLTESQKIAEASRQFESILLKQVLDASQKTVIKSSLSDDSTTTSIYKDMVSTQLADCISRSGGFGLARSFQSQLEHIDKLSSHQAEAGTAGATAMQPRLRGSAQLLRSPRQTLTPTSAALPASESTDSPE
jgi:Rod binding domain-containing protein